MKPDQSWRPNWGDLNSGVYPDHGDDLEAWAWEFLRRNPEYQADYQRWAELPDDDGEGNHSPKYGGGAGPWMSMQFFLQIPGVPACPGETVGEYEKRAGQGVDLIYEGFRERWMTAPEDPAIQHSNAWEMPAPPYGLEFVDPLLYRRHQMLSGWLIYGAGWSEEEDRFVAPVGFDLRYNLDDQWATIREALLDKQKGTKSEYSLDAPPVETVSRKSIGQRGKYETRLRYLDAIAAGATAEQIINKLCPSASYRDDGNDESDRFNNAARAWLSSTKQAAEELMMSKYREMLVFAQIEKAKR